MNTLSSFLDKLEARYHRREFLASDPLEFVHHYAASPFTAHDQEAVALMAALLAYGNVKQIRRSIGMALGRMKEVSGTPTSFVRQLGGVERTESTQATRAALSGWVHRFNTGDDLVTLFELLAESWRRYGSLGAHFNSLLRKDDADFGRALVALIAEWKCWLKEARRKPQPSFFYFLTSPAAGSCCKRWCMFLRWMGRHDPGQAVDPGLWTVNGALASTFQPGGARLAAHQLVMPLDTHTSRICRYIGLTARKSVNWKMAIEVTNSLRECSVSDPVRYDFSLARLGILDVCRKSYRAGICEKCDLFSVCRLANKGTRARIRKERSQQELNA